MFRTGTNPFHCSSPERTKDKEHALPAFRLPKNKAINGDLRGGYTKQSTLAKTPSGRRASEPASFTRLTLFSKFNILNKS